MNQPTAIAILIVLAIMVPLIIWGIVSLNREARAAFDPLSRGIRQKASPFWKETRRCDDGAPEEDRTPDR